MFAGTRKGSEGSDDLRFRPWGRAGGKLWLSLRTGKTGEILIKPLHCGKNFQVPRFHSAFSRGPEGPLSKLTRLARLVFFPLASPTACPPQRTQLPIGIKHWNADSQGSTRCAVTRRDARGLKGVASVLCRRGTAPATRNSIFQLELSGATTGSRERRGPATWLPTRADFLFPPVTPWLGHRILPD
jgi:hypothetical protein